MNISSASQIKTAFFTEEGLCAQWLNQGNQERRRQAFHAFPGIVAWLIGCHEDPSLSSKILGPALDEGRSMYRVVSEALLPPHGNEESLPHDFFSTLERGLRRLIKLPSEQKPTLNTLQLITSGYFCRTFTYKNTRSQSLSLFLWNMGIIETIDMPKNQIQFEQMAYTMGVVFSALFSDKLHYNWKRAKSYRRYFNAAIEPLNKASDNWVLSRDFLGNWKNHQGEVVRWITTSLAERKPEKEIEICVVDAFFFEHFTMKQWLHASEVLHRFHAESTTRHAKAKEEQIRKMKEGKVPSLWDAGGPRETKIHGVSIRALTHPLSLLKEGKEMGHCVAGYHTRCFHGKSRIYALQDMETQERATLELVQHPCGTKALEVVEAQLRAPNNKMASDTLKRAAGELVQTINRQPQEAWEVRPISAEWNENPEEDPVFKKQVQQWLQSRHKNLFGQAVEKLALGQADPSTQTIGRRPVP